MKQLLLTSREHATFMLRHGGIPRGVDALMLTPGSGARISPGLKRGGLPPGIGVFGIDDLPRVGGIPGCDRLAAVSVSCPDGIINSALPFLLIDRSTSWRLRSNFRNAVRMATVVRNSAQLLGGMGIGRLICCSTPHELLTYLFARTAECMGAEVLILEKTPLLHRYWALHGLENRPPVGDVLPSIPQPLSPRTLDFVGSLRSADVEASEVGLRAQRATYGRHSMSLAGEIRRDGLSLVRYPWRIVSAVRKRRLFAVYTSLCRPVPGKDSKIVSFFLHYQPERTTLPEGRIFVLQHLAIAAVAAGIPPGWEVCVREHPSTWLRRLSLACRDEHFYRSISAIPGVRFVANDVPTRDLIDRSEIVSTITGKVGFQALCRGRVALVFGDAGYRTHPRCVSAVGPDDVRRAVRMAEAGPDVRLGPDGGLHAYLSAIESLSIEDRTPIGAASGYETRLATMQELIRRIAGNGSGVVGCGDAIAPPACEMPPHFSGVGSASHGSPG